MRDETETPVRQRLVAVLCDREPGAFEDQKISLRKFDSENYNFVKEKNPNIKGDVTASWWAIGSVAKINAERWDQGKVQWTRAVRAIALLEHINTPPAIAILKDMASGHPDAQPTRAAKDALTRIAAAQH